MKKHSFKRIKKRIVFRVLPFILAFLMLLTSAPVAVFSTDEKTGESAAAGDIIYDYDTLKITLDGEEISSMSIYPYEKIEISGTGVPENATYQWQIKHPEKNNLWVNIYDAKSDTIGVSAALINNMLAEDGTAKLRLRAYTDDYAYLSNPVTVTLLEEAQPEQTLSVKNITFPHAMAGETSETPEFVTVTIEYVRYDYYKNSDGNYVLDTAGTSAFTSYVATLLYGGNLENQKVVLPTIIGYNAYLCDHSTPDHSVDNNDAEIIKELTLNYTNITENITLQVDYLPANVDYSVRYYFQNIYDDLYVEDTDEKTTTKGPTGSEPDEALMQKPFAGFTPLYHQPDTIAADGSTVFEVYYERNYYLMEFDCAGGYGVETLYVRYGSYISIPDPVKPGYVFEGWDLVKTDNPDNTEPLGDPVLDVHGNETGFYEGDGHENVVDTTMPPYNTAYKALWGVADTTYTVVYWIRNSDGTKTYIGSRPVDAKSANRVSGSDDLTADTNVCGLEEHTHTDCTISCGKTEHTHGEDCCNVPEHIHGADCCAIHVHSDDCLGNCTHQTHERGCYTFSGGTVSESSTSNVNNPSNQGTYGDLNVYRTGNRYYVLIDGEYYQITLNRGQVINQFASTLNCSHTHETECYSCAYPGITHDHTSGCVYCSETAHTHGDENCVYCSLTVHAHNEKCYSCGKAAHTHSTACKNVNAPYMEFVEADQDVLVEGDGSTVVNVYYRYKLFEIRFLYARQNNSTGNYEIANSTTAGVIEGQANEDGGWDQQTVTGLPTISGYEVKTEVIGNYTYYYFAIRARYNESIEDIWPSSSTISDITDTHTDNRVRRFGSWAAEAGSGYRIKYGDNHANIVGPYPYMNSYMIKAANLNTPIVENGTTYYIAQRMGAWWGAKNKESSVDWLGPIGEHSYHIYYEAIDGKGDVEYNGKWYDLVETHTFYAAHNGSTRVDPFEYEGVTCINNTRGTSNDLQSNSSNFANNPSCPNDIKCAYCNCFYYDRNTNKFAFYNFNAVMDGKGDENAAYGTPLSEYRISADDMQNKYYPNNLEPNAYEFGGWYTTPECFPGTEVNWDTLTMPDGDLTLYAKWTPVLRNVTFYTDYNDVPSATNPGGTPFLTATDVPHGSLLGTAYYEIPDKGDEYQFVGWFYMDENNKKRFAPDSMEITRDLVLFAEWQTGIDTEYEVQYKLGENATIGGTTYPAGTVIADTDTAHSSVGKTKTFNAKGAYQLYPAFRKSIFPTVNSHSILMEPDKNDNTFVFEYVYDEKVFYKVRYVDYSTRTEIAASNVKSTDEAIVTEKFLPVSGYMPMPHNYYITKALMTDGYSDGSTIEDENVITFYYIKDTEHGLYSIEYYVENLDSSGAEINASNYETITEQDYQLHQSIVNMADLGATITADIISIDGYEYQTNFVVTYETDGDPETPTTKTPVTAGGVTTITGTDDLDYTGLSIKIYYKRITYPYVIKFVDSYSQDILGYGKLDSAGNIVTNTDGTPKVFASINDINTDEAKFEKTISYTAPATISHDGSLYVLNGEIKKERKIAAETVPSGKTYNDLTNNVIVFYYNQKQVTVKYTAVCKVPGATDFGRTSIGSEIAATISGLGGSEAIELDGYYFAGWYTDKDCTTAVDSSWITGKKIKPQTLDQTKDVIEYYALFKPVSSTLVIKKNVDVTTTDTFLFHIKGTGKFEYVDMVVSIQGSGSVTVNEIPQGTYTITELTDWSWEYDCTSDIKTLTIGSEQATAEFANTANDKNWLNGEAVNENQFN